MSKLISKRQKLIFFVIPFVFIFLLIFVNPFRAGFKNFSLKVFLSPARFLSGITGGVKTGRSIAEENKDLRAKLMALSLEIEQFKDLYSENKRLRGLLDFKKNIGFNTVSAEVIARNPNDWIGSFIVDKGSLAGVRDNSAVCSAKGLLGKVVDARDNDSSVMLITHPGFKTGGMIQDSRINGIIVGAGEGKVTMLYLPIDSGVKKGDIVVTSGFSKIFPKGIPVGMIISVEKSKTGLYKYVTIKPSADSFDQEEVLCIK